VTIVTERVFLHATVSGITLPSVQKIVNVNKIFINIKYARFVIDYKSVNLIEIDKKYLIFLH